MALYQSNRCYACQKIFCCSDCCVNHIKNKHPGRQSQCPLCRYEPLIIRKFEHEQFICHIVFNHLPLYCRTCGELFENEEDLKAIGPCGHHPLITIEPPTFIELSKSTSTINTPSSFNKTPCQSSSIDTREISIDGGYNNNFVNFTSPPELTRNTSTPMHISIMKKNYNLQYKTMSKIPNIILTTPSFSRKTNDSNNSNVSVVTSNSKLNEAESIYCSMRSSMKCNSLDTTPLKSILSMKSMSTSDYSKNISDKKLASMEEVDENEIDMELTDVHGAIFTGDVTPPVIKSISTRQELKDSGKRVRFLDEFKVASELDNKHDVSEVDEFFEARQSLGEMSMIDSHDLNTKNSSDKILSGENCKNIDEKVIDNDNNDSGNVEESKNSAATKNQGIKLESSSRVVMMVVVEQSGNGQSTDLAPLIDSSLKKLSSALSKSIPIQNNSTDINDDNTKNTGKVSIVSVDTYTSLSTVECFKAPNVELIPPKNRSMTSNINLSGSGILSAVANAVKSAFKNLSGVTLAKNPTTSATTSKDISQLASTSPLNTSDKSSSPASSLSSSSSLGIIANSTMNSSSRPGKRSRDEVDAISFELPEVSDIQKNMNDNQNDVRSPLQKRQCGWYRQVRGREPIARMKKSYSSPRGISSEKQCYQQGSLTVGDTVLPLPSRAHQSTQTD